MKAHKKTSALLAAIASFAVLLMGLPPRATAEASQEAQAHYQQARDRLIEERTDAALALFRQVVEDYPGSDVADDAQYYVGYCLERQGKDREAIEAFDDLLERWPDSVRAESAVSRRAELAAHDRSGGSDNLDWLRSRETSWEVRRDAAYAMARAGSLDGHDILEEAMRREGSGRQSELIRILAPMVERPEARRILTQALETSNSTSVQIQAIQALAPVISAPPVVSAISGTLSPGAGRSTSVQLKAISALAKKADLPEVRSAITHALQPGGSTSVQIAACDALEGHLLETEVQASVLALYQPGVSTSVQLKGLKLLARERQDPRVVAVIQAALGPGLSTSVQLEAVKLAESSSDSAIQNAASAALRPNASTSVQLRALKSMEHSESLESAAAIESLLEKDDISTSVQLQALTTLSHHEASPSYARAVASVISPGRSTSVQLRALELAIPLHYEPEIHRALIRLLGESDNSTSVQLKALDLLGRRDLSPEVIAIIGKTLEDQGSTSVQLKAVEILKGDTEIPEVRNSLILALHSDRSTSVVLEALRALERRVQEPEVRRAFVRVMEDDDISSTARVRAGKALVRLDDDRLAPIIADAMEDVVIGLTRDRHSWSTPRDLIAEALGVLRSVDPARADRLEKKID